jgi:hypothetical protein
MVEFFTELCSTFEKAPALEIINSENIKNLKENCPLANFDKKNLG